MLITQLVPVCVLLMHVLLMSLFIYSTFVALKNRLAATGFSCIFYGFAIVSLAPVCLMLVFGYQKVQLFFSFVRSTSFLALVWVWEGWGGGGRFSADAGVENRMLGVLG